MQSAYNGRFGADGRRNAVRSWFRPRACIRWCRSVPWRRFSACGTCGRHVMHALRRPPSRPTDVRRLGALGAVADASGCPSEPFATSQARSKRRWITGKVCERIYVYRRRQLRLQSVRRPQHHACQQQARSHPGARPPPPTHPAGPAGWSEEAEAPTPSTGLAPPTLWHRPPRPLDIEPGRARRAPNGTRC